MKVRHKGLRVLHERDGAGASIGHATALEHMMLDGLEDPFGIPRDGSRRSMGMFGEGRAERCRFTRDDRDAFAACPL